MEIDLRKLNALSFERLIRAMCFQQFGPGGIVFSPGPDGGRDFAITGSIAGYESREWKGYLVVQAKFRDCLEGGQSDIDWLTGQIDRELAQYESPTAGRKRPEYYVVATNVALSGSDGRGASGAPRTGGHTKIVNNLESWKTSLV